MIETELIATYPRVSPVFVPVIVSPNKVEFRSGPWSGPAFEIVDDEAENTIERLVELLDGTNHKDEILQSFDEADRDEIAQVLLALQEKSILRDTDSPVDDWRANLSGYLSVTDAAEADVESILMSTVSVIGSGTVGQTVARDLADSGIEDLRLWSLDQQPLDEITSDAPLTAFDETTLEETVEQSDFVVLTTDRPYPVIASRLNELAHEQNTPWTMGVVNGMDGQVGPTVYPGETACYECFTARRDALVDSGIEYSQIEQSDRYPSGLHVAFGRVVAGLTTLDVLKQLSSGFGMTTGSVVNVDFFDFEVQSDEVLRMPRCDVCGTPSDRVDAPRHVTLDHLVSQRGD